MPAVMVSASPKGFPTAMTHSPTRRLEESPILTGLSRDAEISTSMTATSE